MRDLDLREKAELLRQLAHPTRLMILEELSGGPRCVSDLQDLLSASQANVSQHLCVLRQAKLVDWHEVGQFRSYFLSRPSLVEALLRLLSGRYPVERSGAKAERRAAPQTPAARPCSSRSRARTSLGAGTG